MSQLTDKQKKWIITNFKNTKNDDIMMKIGINHSTLHRFARENGLKKTKQFQSKCQLNASEKAKESHIKNKTYPPKGYIIPKSVENRFKSGITPEKKRTRNE
jgi:DNA-binding MurR/RpiR family transcriptional regulator